MAVMLFFRLMSPEKGEICFQKICDWKWMSINIKESDLHEKKKMLHDAHETQAIFKENKSTII